MLYVPEKYVTGRIELESFRMTYATCMQSFLETLEIGLLSYPLNKEIF